MQSVIDIVSLFFQSEFLPLFVYEKGSYLCCFPDSDLPVQPPMSILNALRAEEKAVALYYGASGCSYFRVQADPVYEVFGGPVPLTWIDEQTLSALCREYLIGGSHVALFYDYLRRIPPYNTVVLGQKLNLLLYCLGGDLRTQVTDEMMIGESFDNNNLEKRETDRSQLLYKSRSAESYNNSYEIEALLQKFISAGDLEGYEAFIKNLPPMNTGQLAAGGLRNTKNNFIVTTAIACRTAIIAGVPRDTAYALSDSYINEVENKSSISDILRLNSSMVRDYITRVQRIKESSAGDTSAHSRLLSKCINYIHRNLNHRLSVEDIADYVGFSRSYLSTVFREGMGVPLNRYILDAKLEEAASLLHYTDRPIADIAEYLCFSSQSHFQQAFKSKFHTTPRAYRAQNVLSKKQ